MATITFTHAQLQELQTFIRRVEDNDGINTDGMSNPAITALVEALNAVDDRGRVPTNYHPFPDNG